MVVSMGRTIMCLPEPTIDASCEEDADIFFSLSKVMKYFFSFSVVLVVYILTTKFFHLIVSINFY